MNETTLAPEIRRIIDNEHLRLLAIFHFIGAGLALLALVFVALHFAFMHAIFTSPGFLAQQRSPMPLNVMGILLFVYAIFGSWFLVSLILNTLSGWFLLKRKHRIFSMIVAVINCLHIPFGTILGVFTLVVLARDSVEELYETRET